MLASSSSDEEVDDNSQQQSSNGPISLANRSARGHPGRGSFSAAPGQIIRNVPSQAQHPSQQKHNGSRYPRSSRQVFSSTSSRSSIRSNDTLDGINPRSRWAFKFNTSGIQVNKTQLPPSV
ncbi:unnamed protein product [Rodentolepis nana]|uniref:Uncharacterized protein n=1 Tax=Rodentolepis nana TaxID=102285 RepID=A0A0R3TR23_RODNA|nr:unnamed protein product [Rodentolepis nana]